MVIFDIVLVWNLHDLIINITIDNEWKSFLIINLFYWRNKACWNKVILTKTMEKGQFYLYSKMYKLLTYYKSGQLFSKTGRTKGRQRENKWRKDQSEIDNSI